MHQQAHSDIIREIPATITSKGQVTIPAAVRRYLGLKTNDKIAFVIARKGDVWVKTPRYPTIKSLRGAAGSLGTTRSWDGMRRIAYEDRLEAKYNKK